MDSVLHPNFKSTCVLFKNGEDLLDFLRENYLLYNDDYSHIEKRVPHRERKIYGPDYEYLRTLKFNLQYIDRLYHHGNFVEPAIASEGYELFYRHNRDFYECVYVHMKIYTDEGFDSEEGEMYVTQDPDVFLRSVVKWECNPRKIWKSMVEDDLKVQEPIEFDYQKRGEWRNVPTLKFLCLMKVYEKCTEENLENCQDLLPATLLHDVRQFIKIRSARVHHDDNYPVD